MKVTEWKCEMVSCAKVFAKSMGTVLIMMMLVPGASKVFSQEVEAEIKVDGQKPTTEPKVAAEGNSEVATDTKAAEVKAAEAIGEAEPKPAEKKPSEEKPAEQPQAGEAAPTAETDGANATVTANKPVVTHSVAMAAIHNYYRAQSGLSAQSVDDNLTNVAQNWANHMASVGSMYHGGGEQIIAYSGGDRSYDAGFRTWLGSSPHRAWLCSRGDRCGFGYAIGRNGCAYYAGAFGSSYSAAAVSTSNQTYQSNSYSYNYNTSSRRRFFRRRG